MNTSKNYKTDNGDKWVVGGTLEIEAGASVTGITTATLVNNLTSTDTNKALTAAQGKALKDLVDTKADADDLAEKLTADAATNQADSTATELAGLVSDFNTLLGKLKTAGIMVDDD